jgi:hypothetical protein
MNAMRVGKDNGGSRESAAFTELNPENLSGLKISGEDVATAFASAVDATFIRSAC